MSDDDNQSQSEKEKLLEEIRRRAEEAELKRLEEEETQAPAEVPTPVPVIDEVSPPPAPPVEQTALPPKAVRDQKVLVIRERLTIALDRGKYDKAVELLNELSTLLPGSSEVEEFRQRISVAREQKRQTQGRKRMSSERKSATDSSVGREGKAAQRKKVLELLDLAQSNYQQEKYDRALESVEELLGIDPGNEDGESLKQQIVKAQRIAELIKREEARARAEQASLHPAREEEPVAPISHEEGEVWGTSTAVQPGDMGLELPPEEKGPLAPPKLPLVSRMANRVSKIKIPVKTLSIIGGALVLAVAGYLLFDSIKNAVAPPLYSVLVYPASTAATDSASLWTADGLTEGIISDLAGISGIRVIGEATSFAFKNSGRDVVRSARGLGANFALQISLGRVGDKIALQSSLYDSLKGRVVWSSTMQSSLRELPATRREVVRKLLAFLEVELKPEEETALRRTPTPAAGSFDLYLRARAMLRAFDGSGARAVIDAFQQAVRADSFYAEAHAGLGWAFVRAYEADREGPEAYLTQARWSVQRALTLTQRNAETFRAWGVVEQYGGQRLKAVERLEQAVAIAPSDAEAQRRLAIASLSAGRMEQALKAAQRAVADDPGSVDSYTVLAEVQQYMGDFKSASQNYDLGLRLAPDKSGYAAAGLVDVLVRLQQHERAIDILQDRLARVRDSYEDLYKLARVQQLAGRSKAEWFSALQRARTVVEERLRENPRDAEAFSWKAMIHTRLGEFKDATAALKQAQEIDPNDIAALYNGARMYALQSDKSQALELLRRAVTRRYSLPSILDMDFYNLRPEPDFQQIVAH
jgi:tetratricopeptide (TPR) repeat protein